LSIAEQRAVGFILAWSLAFLHKESKLHRIKPILPRKSAWDFSRKKEYNSILRKWQMYFQASDYKERNFLELNNDDRYPICLSYSKGGA